MKDIILNLILVIIFLVALINMLSYLKSTFDSFLIDKEPFSVNKIYTLLQIFPYALVVFILIWKTIINTLPLLFTISNDSLLSYVSIDNPYMFFVLWLVIHLLFVFVSFVLLNLVLPIIFAAMNFALKIDHYLKQIWKYLFKREKFESSKKPSLLSMRNYVFSVLSLLFAFNLLLPPLVDNGIYYLIENEKEKLSVECLNKYLDNSKKDISENANIDDLFDEVNITTSCKAVVENINKSEYRAIVHSLDSYSGFSAISSISLIMFNFIKKYGSKEENINSLKE